MTFHEHSDRQTVSHTKSVDCSQANHPPDCGFTGFFLPAPGLWIHLVFCTFLLIDWSFPSHVVAVLDSTQMSQGTIKKLVLCNQSNMAACVNLMCRMEVRILPIDMNNKQSKGKTPIKTNRQNQKQNQIRDKHLRGMKPSTHFPSTAA